jgi:hypothetical protein
MGVISIILIIVVIIILLVYFIFEYLEYNKTSKLRKWPPIGRPLPCPDYWLHKGNNVCVNVHKQGTGYPDGQKYVPEFDMKTLSGCLGRNQNNKRCLRSKCNFAQISNNPWFGVQPNCVESGRCYCPN